MVIKLMLEWWYLRGFKWAWHTMIVARLSNAMEYFSVKALIRTLFSPYKQTYSGPSGKGIEAIFRYIVDAAVSRVLGFLVRSILIFAGLFYALGVIITGLILLIVGPFLPMFIVFSILLAGLR
jgi:hypothetical protein